MRTRSHHLRTPRRDHGRRRRRDPRGFTLVELMISVAIVLVLMLGINYVFSTSSRTVSTGMALSTVGRDMRNVRRVMQGDFDNAAAQAEMPGLLIHSEVIAAFLNRQDLLTDQDYNVNDTAANREQQTLTYDVDGEPGDEINLNAGTLAYTLNHRRHRFDRISFFAAHKTGEFTRQTGDASTYVATDTSPEAWIGYGPLRLAQNNDETRYVRPGAEVPNDNPNNFFASQWILGRRVTLLKNGPYATGTTVFTPVNPLTNPALNLASRAAASNITRENGAKGGPYSDNSAWLMPESRVDMANASLAQLMTDPSLVSPTGVWHVDFDDGAGVVDHTDIAAMPYTLNFMSWAKTFVNKSAMASPTGTMNYADRVANMTREVALTTPIFVRGVSQFIVEFAGDFYDQGPTANPAGGPPVPEPVGTIDYVPLPGGAGAGSGGSQIRWYGAPRDVDGNGTVDEFDVQPISVPPPAVPGAGGPPVPRWAGPINTVERVAPTGAPAPGAPYIWAWGPPVADGNPTTPAAGFATPAEQGNPFNVRPSLVRITMELTDANGRLPDGQRIEYVFKLR